MSNAWNVEQYERFKKERAQPFRDLLAMVRRQQNMKVVDLGSGTGETTRALHDDLKPETTVGIDNAPSMLQKAVSYVTPGLTFESADVQIFEAPAHYDLIFSNATLQWITNHPALIQRLTKSLAPAGQLAFQVPANFDHVSHRLATQLAQESPFKESLQGYVVPVNVLSPETYAVLLHSLGFREQSVRLQVYGHSLKSGLDVVEWVKGTHLTAYQERLSPPLFEKFLETYTQRLTREIGTEPYFYTYKRILAWGILG